MKSGDSERLKLRGFLTAEDAVSPVIGVILMVAITVILAGIMGTFALGLYEGERGRTERGFRDGVQLVGKQFDRYALSR